MKNILIPTDFSKNAWNATKYALSLFADEECTFHLLNTYTPSIPYSRFMATTSNIGLEDSIIRSSEKGLKKTLSLIKVAYKNPKHTFKTISSFRLLVDEVKELVEHKNIDLVVTGTKGASGLEEVFMGSNTVRILRTVHDCPVLAIPEHFYFETPSEIAFATDFNRFYTVSELQPLIEIANTFNAVVRFVHVQNKIKALTELQLFNLSMLRKYFVDVEHYVHTVSEINSVSKTLEIFSEELDIHLLAMLNYQHSYTERLTREPVVKRIAFHTQVPLLILPELSMHKMSKGKNQLSFSN